MTNMKTTHTPGPWKYDGPHPVVDAETNCFSIYHGDGISVAMVIFMPGEDDREQCRADAALISAAPDLLAACQRFLNPTEEGPRLEDIIRAAVAKATTP